MTEEESPNSNLLIDVFDGCNEYMLIRDHLSKHLSSGLMQIALARKASTSVARIEDIRTDFDATIGINNDSLTNETWDISRLDGDDIQLFCGMPPRPLRTAQSQFQLAIEDAVKLVQQLHRIQSNINKLENK